MHRRNMLSLAVVLAFTASGVRAQDKGEIKRKMLTKQELTSAPGHEAVLSQVELAPGAAEAKHTHPGELLGFVDEGTLTLFVEGKQSTLERGESFFVPAGAIHWGENHSKKPVRIIATLILEKGKPPTTAAR
ncbi:MAG TPA: cupin domain-containing protein [Myxococcales bacterium]